MRPLPLLFLAITPVILGACSSSVTDAIDGTLQKRINTIENCFPMLQEKVDQLLEITKSWNNNTTTMIPDPTGLTWTENGDGSLDVDYTVGACQIDMTIVFYSPTGVQQDLDLTGATTLSEAIDAAATELATLFGATDKFMVGSWTMSGGATGTGNLTGIIGGATNQNELEELRTTEATPAGGPPALASSTITEGNCTLTLSITSLKTDIDVDQQYPEGTITMTIVGEETVNASVVFNKTVTATITVSSVPGSFAYNIDTGSVSYSP